MALNHIYRETIFHRESNTKSWSVLVAYSFDDESGKIVAEMFETHRNRRRPHKAYRKTRGQFVVAWDKVPEVVLEEWRRLTASRIQRVGYKESEHVVVKHRDERLIAERVFRRAAMA